MPSRSVSRVGNSHASSRLASTILSPTCTDPTQSDGGVCAEVSHKVWSMRHCRPLPGRALIAGSGAGATWWRRAVPFLGRYGWDRGTTCTSCRLGSPRARPCRLPSVTAWVGVGRYVCHRRDSLEALRAVSLACGVATVILVALMARELGGGFAAQFGGAARLSADAADPRLGEHLSPDLVRPARLGGVPIRRDANPRKT